MVRNGVNRDSNQVGNVMPACHVDAHLFLPAHGGPSGPHTNAARRRLSSAAKPKHSSSREVSRYARCLTRSTASAGGWLVLKPRSSSAKSSGTSTPSSEAISSRRDKQPSALSSDARKRLHLSKGMVGSSVCACKGKWPSRGVLPKRPM